MSARPGAPWALARSDQALLKPIAEMVLACVRREYPNHPGHTLAGDQDARPPRELTPAFFGSFDWHSAVHGHWCLARLLRLDPGAAYAARAAEVLSAALAEDVIAREVAFVRAPGREGFERPYGLAWVLQLAAELRTWGDVRARGWGAALAPLETLAAERLGAWLAKLPFAVRSGEHSQTAFALGLALDWADTAGERSFADAWRARARGFFGGDRDAPIDYEPSGHDFLSPILGEADLMRRVLEPAELVSWLGRFLPDLEGARAARWLTPVTPADRGDGKLAHLDGLNLSRAWMLEGILSRLPTDAAGRVVLESASRRHRSAGLEAVPCGEYAGAHWLGTYAVYLLTGRGIASVGGGHKAERPAVGPGAGNPEVRGDSRAGGR